jgi:tetratricopeptide (TPR) repeat protein
MGESVMKKLLLSTLLLLITGSLTFAQSFTVTVLPTLEIPLAASADLYTAGGGVDITGIYSLGEMNGLRFSGAAGYRMLPSLGSTNLSVFSLTGGLGYQHEVLSRLLVFADARAGVYYGLFGDTGAMDLLAATEIGLVFSMSSAFQLGAGASLAGYFADPEPLFSGLGIRLVGSFAPGRKGTGKPRLQIMDPRLDPIFPVFFKWYDSNPCGSIVIVNKESRTISNVKASILVQEFMDTPKVFAEIAELGKGESIEVPILALFNDEILTVTESTKVAAEITVSYDLPNGELQVMHAETLRVLDRNAMNWNDDQRAASFVTPRDPAVLSLAKSVASAVRDDGGTVGDLNFRVAMAMFEALNLYGVSYVVDPKSSYADLSVQASAVDYLQFPRQTLKFRSGDCDDLSILYTSLLEAVGIETAFITVPGHILAAVALSLSPEEAQRQFSRSDRLIVDNGVVYVPVEATIFSKGFNAAWIEGARQWRDAGSAARLIPVREAWKNYEPVGLREADPELLYPSSEAILADFRSQLDRFVSDELAPKVAALESTIRTRGATARDLNRLGVLYARYGRYADAEIEFQKILQQENKGYVPAMVNLANVCYMRGELASAAAWYDRALLQEPQNRHALSGSIKVKAEMGDAVAASNMLDRLRTIDSTAADSLAHLTTNSTGEGRASSAQAEKRVDWAE